ncbi:MAG: OmpA family protein [Thiotrichaceae bacterium]
MKTKTLTVVSTALLLSFSFMPSVSAHEGDYLTDSSGNAVKDSSGKCVKAALGNMLEGCGTPAPAPVVEAAPEPVAPPPAPAPKPVAPAPKPAPVVRAAPAAPKVHILNLNESGGSNFATNSAKLSAKANQQLTRFSNTVKGSKVSPSNITIIGHTDSRGSTSHNQKLSVKRAQSVANFLASQGMNRGAMHVGGRGESQPIASNKTKAGRAANRRVAITVKGQRSVMGK